MKANKKKYTESTEKALESLVLKPVERQGEKNIYCPHYALCLDHAVQKGWQYWDCAECPKKMVRRPLDGCGEVPTQTFEYHDLLHTNMDLF